MIFKVCSWFRKWLFSLQEQTGQFARYNLFFQVIDEQIMSKLGKLVIHFFPILLLICTLLYPTLCTIELDFHVQYTLRSVFKMPAFRCNRIGVRVVNIIK